MVTSSIPIPDRANYSPLKPAASHFSSMFGISMPHCSTKPAWMVQGCTLALLFWRSRRTSCWPISACIGSPARSAHHSGRTTRACTDHGRSPTTAITVPTGCCEFPGEILLPPQSLAARTYTDIHRWSVMPRGGHFCGNGATQSARRRDSPAFPAASRLIAAARSKQQRPAGE
jgi:hypothetical protein